MVSPPMSESFAYITLLFGRAGTACVQAFLLASCSFSVLRLRVTSMPLQLSYVNCIFMPRSADVLQYTGTHHYLLSLLTAGGFR